jgi:hypothetical protein
VTPKLFSADYVAFIHKTSWHVVKPSDQQFLTNTNYINIPSSKMGGFYYRWVTSFVTLSTLFALCQGKNSGHTQRIVIPSLSMGHADLKIVNMTGCFFSWLSSEIGCTSSQLL